MLSKIYSQDKNIIRNDSILNKIHSSLLHKWIMYKLNGELIIERKDSIWVMFENKINAPLNIMNKEERIKQIKTSGKKVKASIVFVIEKKWTKSKVLKSRKNNLTIVDSIFKLPSKYNIEHLINIPYKDDSFIGIKCTNEEKKRISQYLKEKKNWENSKIRIPDYNTENFSLFLKIIIGKEDEYHSIYPEEVSEEIYKIQKNFEDNCPVLIPSKI